MDPQSADLNAKLNSPDIKVRQKAIADCIAWVGNEVPEPRYSLPDAVQIEEELAPLLVDTALKETSLAVRAQAIAGLNELFAESPGFPKGGLDLVELSGLNAWWKEQTKNYKELEWISRMRLREGNTLNLALNSTALSDALVKVRGSSSAIRDALQSTILQLRNRAAEPYQKPFERVRPAVESNGCQHFKADLAEQIDMQTGDCVFRSMWAGNSTRCGHLIRLMWAPIPL